MVKEIITKDEVAESFDKMENMDVLSVKLPEGYVPLTKEQEYGLPRGWEILSYDDSGAPKTLHHKELHLKVFRFEFMGKSYGWAWNVSVHGSDTCGDLEIPPPDDNNHYRTLCLDGVLTYSALMENLYHDAETAYNKMVEQ